MVKKHGLARSLVSAVALAALFASPALAAGPKITFLFTDDDANYVKRMEELTKEYAAASGNEVEFVSSGYDAVQKQLPMQLAVGQGPDVAKITDWQLAPFYLDMRPLMKDPDAFAKLHGETLDLLRLPNVNDPASLNGYVASQTLNLPFVNVTLFKQAGVPLPGPKATLKEIAEASKKVAEATGTQIPFTLDRSGHRFSGGIYAYGGDYLKDGKIAFPDDGAKAYIADLYGFTRTGAFPKEMWGAAGGSAYKNMGDEFVNGHVVTYLAGNWMINPFQTKIGDAFEWRAINAPCGPAGCYTWPGSTAIVGFKHSKNPQAVAGLIEFLGSEKVQRELSEKYAILTGAKIKGRNFQLKDENARESMMVFLANLDKVPKSATAFTKTKGSVMLYQAIVQRMTQLIVGEAGLDDTYKALANDVAKINQENTAK